MGKLFVVMYHYTRDLKHSRYPEIKGLDVSLFREQIEFMKQQFNIVSMEQVIEAVERHADLPDKALLLTFDDGYVDNYTFAFPIFGGIWNTRIFFYSRKNICYSSTLECK